MKKLFTLLAIILTFGSSAQIPECIQEHKMCWDLYDMDLTGSQCFTGYGSIHESVKIYSWDWLRFNSTTASLNYAPDLETTGNIYANGYAVNFWGNVSLSDTIFIATGTLVTIANPINGYNGKGIILMNPGSRIFIGENPKEYYPGQEINGIRIIAFKAPVKSVTILYFIPSLGIYATKR